jgi:hypothetical protein
LFTIGLLSGRVRMYKVECLNYTGPWKGPCGVFLVIYLTATRLVQKYSSNCLSCTVVYAPVHDSMLCSSLQHCRALIPVQHIYHPQLLKHSALSYYSS